MCLFCLNVLCFVIPVLDTGIQHFHTTSSRTLFLHSTFILTNLVKSWIPVPGYLDDILLVLKPQNCHASRAGMTAKSKLLASIMICNRSNEKSNRLT
ncbi:hypothetical protein [Wolbachia pipientis]|uniref:hypothetical protein n=1 Tax=Wolbachia pipientis TaxID=955 RepID=UPI00202EC084|nr:hypothetical protein [Wolbachia pipientis]MCM1002614.1 hypothetical protein [Wolbachia pipientis]